MRHFPRPISELGAPYGSSRIHVLPPEVAHRLAAGEVIACSVSAVEELVENALDAGALRVEVEIEGGGVSLLRVRDDGSGTSPDDALRAAGRHATSKISSAEDLARVLSSGFRGKALHAISSVSSLALTTREPPATNATLIRIAGWRLPRTLTRHPSGGQHGRGARPLSEPPRAPGLPRQRAGRDPCALEQRLAWPSRLL